MLQKLNFNIKNKLNNNTLIPYLVSFIVPMIILLCVKLVYQATPFKLYSIQLSSLHILCNGCAGLSFYYFCNKSTTINLPTPWLRHIFSLAYALCSYGICQQQSLLSLLFFAFFPIAFYYADYSIEHGHYIRMILCNACLLLLDPHMAFPILLLLFIYTNISLLIKHNFSLGTLSHIIICYVLSFLCGAARWMFFYAPYWHEHSAYSYSGFTTNYSWSTFLSRLFLGNTPSSLFSMSGQYMDFYVGMAFFLLCIIFFFQQNHSYREKIGYLFFSLIIIIELNLSPVQYLFHGLLNLQYSMIPESFFLTFWMLYLAARSLSSAQNIRRISLLSAFILFGVSLGISLLYLLHNMILIFVPITIILSLFYCFYFYIVYTHTSSKHKYAIFYIALLIECTINICCITNLNLCPKTVSAYPKNIFQSESLQKKSSNKEAIMYQNYFKDHLDSELYSTLNDLDSLNLCTKKEIQKDAKKDLPNIFDKYNCMVHKLGIRDDLFTTSPATLSFLNSRNYTVTQTRDSLFNVNFNADSSNTDGYFYLTYKINNTETLNNTIYIWNSYIDSTLLSYTKEQLTNSKIGYIRFNGKSGDNYNVNFLMYSINEEILPQLKDAITTYNSKLPSTSFIQIDYIGVVCSYLGLIIILFLTFYDKKEHSIKKIRNIGTTLNNNSMIKKLSKFIYSNRIYILAYAIPTTIYLIMMIVNDCIPFGNLSFLDEDGIGLTFPTKLDSIYSAKIGNKYLSLNAGYNTNLYTNNTLNDVLSVLYKNISPNAVAMLLTLSVGICIGFCSLSMCFYLTHRLREKQANKSDIRLLLPSLIYSLNAYMLSMHGFTNWYITLAAFPLLIYSIEQLIYLKKSCLYIALLSFCIITNLMLGMYMCIFLVIYFFTCKFENWKQFLFTGIRFAICSIIAAGNSFFVIYNTVNASKNLMYKSNDSILPTIGLHGNFLTQWKNYMLFIPTSTVTTDNNYAALFCGILVLLLVFHYFFCSNIKLTEKIRQLIPIIFLSISFNGNMLSYLWNGLHYQTKVPNRYVFILMFLFANMVYDSIRAYSKSNKLCIAISTISVTTFLLICYSFNLNSTTYAFICSIIVCIIYTIALLFFNKKYSKQFYRFIILVFILELATNGIFVSSRWQLANITNYENFVEQRNLFKSKETSFTRHIYLTSYTNVGEVYDTPSISAFNSFINNYQRNLNILLGFCTGANTISAQHLSTPLGLDLSCSRYILIPQNGNQVQYDLSHYNYVGMINSYFVYENPNALSLGLYAPEEITHFSKDIINFAPDYYNGLSVLLTGNDNALLTYQYIQYSDDTTKNNSFYFTDELGNKLSYQEAEALYNTLDNGENYKLQIHIRYKAETTGYAYFYPNEFVGINDAKEGQTFETTIAFPNMSVEFRDAYNIVIMNTSSYQNLQKTLSKNQLENISIKNDTITGTTNYEKDGYTMLSLAYDKGWSAYIDGKKVAVENPYDAGIYIKTPAGKHTLTLKFEPYGMKSSRMISACFWILTALVYGLQRLIRRRKKTLMSE